MLLLMPLVLPLLLSRRFVECEARKREIEYYAEIHTYFIYLNAHALMPPDF